MAQQTMRYLLIAFLVIGGLLGVFVFAPLINIDLFSGGILGVIAFFLLSLLIPDIRENYRVTPYRFCDGDPLTFLEYLVHPIQLPITLGMLWFFLTIVLVLIFPINLIIDVPMYLLIPTLLLSGLSGLLMVLRREFVSRYWFVIKGKLSIFWGILTMIIFWGSGIFLIVSAIFGW